MKGCRYQLTVMGMLVYQANTLHSIKREARVWFKRLGVSYASIWSHGNKLYTRKSNQWTWHRPKGGYEP